MDAVPLGCTMGQTAPVKRLRIGAPFTVLELRSTNIGASGEFFVLQRFAQTLPNFSARNWVSALRLHYFPGMAASGVDNALGAAAC